MLYRMLYHDYDYDLLAGQNLVEPPVLGAVFNPKLHDPKLVDHLDHLQL